MSPVPIEPLEPRIAPATLVFVKPTLATYTDADGDLVTVKFSKPILNEANVSNVLVMTAVDATHDQLQRIDLTVGNLATPAKGVSITVTVVPKAPGDGFAHVGYINATGLDLGAVSIRGDLGAIDAGDATTKTPGVKGLTVQSLGTLGTTTGAPNLSSDIVGALGKLTVKGSMVDAKLDVAGGADGKIGAVSIGVSLIGGSTERSGSLHSSGDMGAVKIGVDLRGGTDNESGMILSDRRIASLTIGHDLFGGGVGVGMGAGLVRSGGDMGKVFIGHTLFGGFGDSSGSIISGGKMGDVRIAGTLQGGIVLIGGGSPRNGFISSVGDMGKVTIDQDIVGTFVPFAGTVISGGKIAAVSVGGSIQGGTDHSGLIQSEGSIGAIKVGGNIQGGNGPSSGSILSEGDLKNVKIGGGLFGGTGSISGVISGKNLGTIAITGGVGGSGSQGAVSFTDSGAILGTTIQKLTIGGLFGGSTGNQVLARSGYISATTIKMLTIAGDMSGGSISGTGSVTDCGSVRADRIGKILITGSLTAGSKGSLSTGPVTRSGAISAATDIGSITIRGDVTGAEDSGRGAVPVVISAEGQPKPSKTKDLAIGSVTIGGNVSLTNILAGYTPALSPVNGGAQIGKVAVVGNWTASNLVAGAMNAVSGNQDFGNVDDASIAGGSPATIAKIASISVGGVVSGTTDPGDHFGFVAHAISAFSIGGIKLKLSPSPSTLDLGATSDVSIHLI